MNKQELVTILEEAVKADVKHYQDDFYNWDVASFEAMEPGEIVEWWTRENGTVFTNGGDYRRAALETWEPITRKWIMRGENGYTFVTKYDFEKHAEARELIGEELADPTGVSIITGAYMNQVVVTGHGVSGCYTYRMSADIARGFIIPEELKIA